jgi:hypothetical protein
VRLHVVVYRGVMAETKRQRVYREEALVLGEIGEMLARADLPNVTVRLPSTLAQAAVAAWQRDDEAQLDRESYEQPCCDIVRVPSP